MLKMGIITGFLSRTKDRFHEYNEPKTLEERLAMVAGMEGIDGVEAVITAADVPGQPTYGLVTQDQPVFAAQRLADAVDEPGQAQGQDGHAEGLVIVVRFDAADPHQLFEGDPQVVPERANT